MLNHFFKIVFRNMSRHKGFTLINLAGLTLGLTACLLIGLFVWDEHQFDREIPNGDRVFRVYNVHTDNNGTEERAVTPPMVATTLKNEFPQVEQTARVMMLPVFKTLFENSENHLYEESGYLVDSTFLDVFPLSFKFGTPVKALDDASSIIISTDLANRLFGRENPVGKTLQKDKHPLKVTGVFERDPKFHLSFHYIIPLSAAQLAAERMQSWGWQQFYNYVKVKPGTNVAALQTQFQQVAKQRSAASNNDPHSTYTPIFQPLRDIHLGSSNFKFDLPGRGNITYVRALTIIAAFILLIACFNFVNLATAKATQRAREVGVRRTIGAQRKQLILQFMGETVVMLVLCILLATILSATLIPWLNQFTNKTLSAGIFAKPSTLLILAGTTVLVGMIAGIYPALVMSAFKPVKVLKSSAAGAEGGKTPWLRHGLVVSQFTISILLIISAVIVYKQVDYLHNKDLGFNKEQIMFFPMRSDSMFHSAESFKQALLQQPGVSSATIGYGFPGDAVAGDEVIYRRNGEKVTLSATQLMVDFDYVKTLGLQLVAGRDFSKEMKTDQDHAFLINETAVKTMGFGTPEKAIGQPLYWHPWDGNNRDSLKEGNVVGVVKDFNYKSLYDKMEPTVLQIYPSAAWKVAVKIKTSGIENTISQVKKVWSVYSPEFPLEFNFLDENFDQMYKSEDKLKTLLWIFTGIAIFVGCLGLFGLATFTAERRRKELGIRKVLGASAQGLVMLLSKDFIKLVLVSVLIASPIAWLLMNKWLQDFAYRITVSIWIFIGAGLLAVVIAFCTVGFQAIKAALANPVSSLRSE